MSGYKEQLDSIKAQVENNKTEKVRLEERQKHLQDDFTEVKKELEELGVAEKDIEDVVTALEAEIRAELAEMEIKLK